MLGDLPSDRRLFFLSGRWDLACETVVRSPAALRVSWTHGCVGINGNGNGMLPLRLFKQVIETVVDREMDGGGQLVEHGFPRRKNDGRVIVQFLRQRVACARGGERPLPVHPGGRATW